MKISVKKNTLCCLSLEGEGGTKYRVRGKVYKANLICTPSSVLRTSSPSRGKWGFTLIELLVVVLIIGILAAVAVPQYRKAVKKTHYAQLQTLTKSIYDAERVYYLAHGSYTTSFADLDIEIPVSKIASKNNRFFKENKVCSLLDSYVACQDYDINMAYRMDYTGEQACVAYNADDTVTHQICKDETKRSGPSEGYSSTYFYP